MDFFDTLIVAAVALLLFFSAFAFGSVDVWATRIAEEICFALPLVWLVKSVIGRRSSARPLLGEHDLRSLAAPVMLLLGFVSFQLMPLKPALLQYCSRHTYALYRTTMAGWPNRLSYYDPGFAFSFSKSSARPVTILPTVDQVRHGASLPFATKTEQTVASARSFEFNHVPSSRSIPRVTSTPLSVAPPLTRAGLLKFAAYASLFFVVGFYPAGSGDRGADRTFRRCLVLSALAAATALAVLGLTQQAFWNGKILWFHVPRDWGGPMLGLQRASGPFANADHFANYLAMVLPLALVGALFRSPLERREAFSGFQLVCIFAALVVLAAIVASLSRAGWAEVGLGVFTLTWFLSKRRGQPVSDEPGRLPDIPVAWGISAIGLLSVVALALILIGQAQTQQVGTRVVDSVSNGMGLRDRWAMWADSTRILRDYPLFGVGLGSWSVIFPHYQRPPWSTYFAGAAQNDYVEAAVEYGIIGLLLFGWICFAAARILFRGARLCDAHHRPLFAALIGAIVIISFHEMFDFCLQIPANAILFVLLVGLAVRLARSYQTKPIRAERGRMAWLGAAGVALMGVTGIASAEYQHETVYPDDLQPPASINQCVRELISHPASALPHIWLADMVQQSGGGWALGELRSAVWLDPNNPRYRDRYVLALLSEGKEEEALHQLKSSLGLAPRLDDHPLLNPRLLPWLPASQRLAIEAGLKTAIDRGYEGSVESLAQLYVAEGREADAASIYAEEARRQQNSALRFQYFLAAGQTYAKANNAFAAENAFRAAASLAPDDSRPYENLITLVYGPEKNVGAVDGLVRTAIDNGITPARLYLLFGQALSAAGDQSFAERSLRKAIDYDPSYANLMLLGEFYLDRGQFDRARDALGRAAQINPQSAQAFFNLAQAEEGAYEFSAAQSDYQRAVALAPDHLEFKSRLKELLAKTKS